MPSSGMLRRVALVTTEVLGEIIASVMKVSRIVEVSTDYRQRHAACLQSANLQEC
jgi:hypothetical protein